jgi:hypothetical protein
LQVSEINMNKLPAQLTGKNRLLLTGQCMWNDFHGPFAGL